MSTRRAKARFVSSLALLIVAWLFVLPCFAQYTQGHAVYDPVSNRAGGSMVADSSTADNAPTLVGATMGTIGPQGYDQTYVTGVNTAGTVRVNMLAMLEALANIVANGTELIALAWGAILLLLSILALVEDRKRLVASGESAFWAVSLLIDISGSGISSLLTLLGSMFFLRTPSSMPQRNARNKFWWACAIIKFGLVIPSLINWLIEAARDANLFS